MKVIPLIFSLFLLGKAVYSQAENQNIQRPDIQLKKQQAINLAAGMKSNLHTAATLDDANVESESTLISSLGYNYWFSNQWSVNVQAGFFPAESEKSLTGISRTTIIPLLVGVRLYPASFAVSTRGFTFIGILAGTYIASANRSSVTGLDIQPGKSTESVFGGQAQIGIDIFVHSHWKVGPQVDYHLIQDFSKKVSSRKNFSGFSFSFEFGYVF
jgi:outer membrane protein W